MVATAALQCGSPHVYCLDIAEMPDPIEWARAKSMAESLGGRIDYRRVDITEEEAVNRVIAGIYDECEHTVAGYFGSAGMIHQIPAVDYPADSFRRVIDVNTTGQYHDVVSTGEGNAHGQAHSSLCVPPLGR
jgi:NAD(P)-dependent dehydrogenase (short-subunit alcohol dehydrogenase family)